MKTPLPYFEAAKQSFEKLLHIQKEDEFVEEMRILIKSLKTIEHSSIESIDEGCFVYRKLFVECFQFLAIIDHEIWPQIPKLHHQIGKYIGTCRDHERRFRGSVKKNGFGKRLLFIN